MRLTLLCAAAALALAGCNATTPDTHDADVKSIGDLEATTQAAWKSHDAAKIAAFYADNAVLMTPGSPATTGKDAISKSAQQMVADPALDLTWHADHIEVAKSGDVAWSRGPYQMTMTDPASHQVVHDHGSYLTTYQKQSDGSWKAVADIATSEVPPPAAAPAQVAPGKHK
jgi:uncharacterized protein (TIGR02246 family)